MMDITKYLSNIEIPVTEEPQIEAFIASKGDGIRNSILKLWEQFVLDEDNQMDLAPANTGTQQNSDSLPLTQSESVDLNPGSIEESNIITSLPDKPNNDKLFPEANDPAFLQQQPPKDEMEINRNDELASQLKTKFITLPNGKVNHPYNFIFNKDKIGIADIEYFWFEGLEPLGILFDPVTGAISGTPVTAGEHTIRLLLKRNGWIEGKPVFERKLTLIINPDPRSLWQSKPSDKNDPYWKPDSASQFLKVESTGFLLKTERKDIVAASQRGRSHAHEGIFRDDDFGMDYDKVTNWYIVAVADGAGSCKVSRKGSQIACQTVVKVCKAQLEVQHKDFEHLIKELSKEGSDTNRKKMGDALYGIVGTAVFKAYKNIEEEAAIPGFAVRDFSTTLIVSICKKFRFGWFVGAFWVGDGGIGIYNKNTRFLRVLGESDGGEFAGQTRFLTMPEITQPTEIYRRLRFDIVDEFTALILMSDGITDPKFETDANLLKIEKWDDLWTDLSNEVEFKDNNEKSAGQLLKWLDFWSPGNHDDRTIAILF